jgi:hypothetical protein
MNSLAILFSRSFLGRLLLLSTLLCVMGATAQAASPYAGTYQGRVVYNVKKYIAGKKVSDKTTAGTGTCIISKAGVFTLSGFQITRAQKGTVSAAGTMGRTQVLIGNGKVKNDLVNYVGFVSSGGSNRTVQTWKFVNLKKRNT